MTTGRITYAVAPGYGDKNSMNAEDTYRIIIEINKDDIYDDARAMLHKFGDARLTAENDYHISVLQADDLDEDSKLFERSFKRAFYDAAMACMAYYKALASNKGYIYFTPNRLEFDRHSKNTQDFDVRSDSDWTLQLVNELQQQADESDTEYLYAIGLMMPSTWQKETYRTLCDNVHDYILFSIVADFLKITEPREYGFYKEEAQKYRVFIKDALEAREPYTRYTEIKPF